MKTLKIIASLLVLLLLLVTTKQLNAQVEKRFKELGIENSLDFSNIFEHNTDYSSSAKFTEITSDKTTLKTASFDPLKPEGSRWTLETINGSKPSTKEIKKFNKVYNVIQENNNAKPDENSMKIIDENEHLLIIGFKYKENDLPKKYKYLAHCDAQIYFDKEAQRLYKVKFTNNEPLKIKIFNVVKLNMTIELMLSDDGKTNLIKDINAVMDVKLFGQLVEITEESKFYNYKKVK